MKTRFWVVFSCVAAVIATNGIVEVYCPVLWKNKFYIGSFLILIPVFFITNAILDWRNGEIIQKETNKERVVLTKKDNPWAFYIAIFWPIIFSLIAITIIIGGVSQNGK
jgi:uncharacterized membrane protein YidH (DUF202 family)